MLASDRFSFLRKLSIKTRLYTVHICIVVGIFVITLIIVNNLARVAILESMEQQTATYVSQVVANIDYVLQRTEELFQNMTTSAELYSSINNYNNKDNPEYMREENGQNSYVIRNKMYELSKSISRFCGVEVCSLTERIASMQTRITTGNIQTSEILQTLEQSKEDTIFLGAIPFENNLSPKGTNKYIVVGGRIQSRSMTKPAGYAVMAFSEVSFHQILNSNPFPNSIAYISDTGGTIISHPDKTLLGAAEDREITQVIDQISLKKERSSLVKVNGRQYLLNYSNSSVNGWRTVMLTDYGKLMDELNWGYVKSITPVLIFIALVALISLIVSTSIIRPINEIVRAIKTTSINRKYPQVAVYGNDEISYLGNEFNSMSNRIQLLLSQTTQLLKKEHAAQLKILEAQINSHFLYNTLDSVNWMAYLSNNFEICDIVNDLSTFFRLSLNVGEEQYTIGDDIEHIRCYLNIQQIRFQHQLQVTYDIDESCLKVKIPKILLQPLVENAILHGLAPMNYKGSITIRVKKGAEGIVLSVEDDGIGMLKTDGVYPISQKTGGFGLSSINKRLELLFGENYSMSITDNVQRGTIVSICIPFLSEENEND